MFNRIHLKALSSLNYNITYCARQSMIDGDISCKNIVFWPIPESYYTKRYIRFSVAINARVRDISILRFLQKEANKMQFDAIVFLSYDVMSLITFRTKIPVFIYDHNNIGHLNNSIKLFLTRRLGSNMVHLVPNSYCLNIATNKLPGKKIELVPHGLDLPYVIEDDYQAISKYVNKGDNSVNDMRFIFCPASSSLDFKFLNNVLGSEKVLDFIHRNNIIIFVKSKVFTSQDDNIVVIKDFLPDNTYQYFLLKSSAVFLPYDKSFGARVSGIFHECLANNVPAIGSNVPAFTAYTDYCNYNPIITNDQDFIKSINEILNTKDYYNKLTLLNPVNSWKELLEN